MASFEDFKKAILTESEYLARDIFGGFVNEAANDTLAFMIKAGQDLQRWINLLEKGEITEEDFADLVQAKKALFEIHNLKQAGVACVNLERFKAKLIDLINNTAFDLFL